MNLRLISFCLMILFVSACGAKQAAKPEETIVVPLVEEEQKLPDIAPVKETSGLKKEERKEEKPAAEKRQEESNRKTMPAQIWIAHPTKENVIPPLVYA